MPFTPDKSSLPKTQSSVVSVHLSERSYDIKVAEGIVRQAGMEIALACCGKSSADGRAALIVTDTNVQPLYGDIVIRSLNEAAFKTSSVCLPDGEAHKTLAAVDSIYSTLSESAADRRTVIVALGGGVVGDIAGFAAASYQRGLDFVQIPTTLLAQVDSSVGGKVGVNYGAAKNLIGAFHQPKMVLIDPETLATLSMPERLSGLAEIIKYGLIADADLFEMLSARAEELLSLESEIVKAAVARSCEIKARIVEQDEREITGARAALNFGHTIGHALEAATHYNRYRHGEAIAIGMVTACLIGEALDITPKSTSTTLVELLDHVGFDIAPDSSIPVHSILDLLALDKKSVGGNTRFVLLDAIGAASSGHPVPDEVVAEALSRQAETKPGKLR